jgi:hypothetical protein
VLAVAFGVSWTSCGGGEGTATPTLTVSTDGDEELTATWMHLVTSDPGAHLGPFEGPTGEAWLSFYHNDLRRTADRFGTVCTPSDAPLAARAEVGYPCVGLARTHLELADLYARAVQVDRVAWRQFHLHRDSHADEVLRSVHEDYFVGVLLLHSGDQRTGLEHLATYAESEGGDPMLVALSRAIGEGLVNGDPLIARVWGGAAADAPSDHPGLGTLPTSPATAAYAARLGFIASVATGDVDAATSQLRGIDPRTADLEEALVQDGSDAPSVDATLRHHDPAYLYALSHYHAHLARRAAGGADDLAVLTAQADRLLGWAPTLPDSAPSLKDGLALVVFGPSPSPADLLAAEKAQPNAVATLRRLTASRPVLGLAPTPNLGDLDLFVGGSQDVYIRLGELLNAFEGGGSLDVDMGLSQRFRSHLLRERAVQFRSSFDIHMDESEGADMVGPGIACRTLLELSFDKNPSPPNNELKQARISYLNDPPLLLMLARAELDTRRAGEANDYLRPLTTLYPELISVRDALTILDTAWNPPREGGGVKQGN